MRTLVGLLGLGCFSTVSAEDGKRTVKVKMDIAVECDSPVSGIKCLAKAHDHFVTILHQYCARLSACIYFGWEVNPHTGESREELRKKIRERIESHPEEINIAECWEGVSSSPLFIAYQMNEKWLVKLLLEKGAVPYVPWREFEVKHKVRGMSEDPEILQMILDARKK